MRGSLRSASTAITAPHGHAGRQTRVLQLAVLILLGVVSFGILNPREATTSGGRGAERISLIEVAPRREAGGRRIARGTLEFKVCNGYANQLLALFYGGVLSLESNRQVFLPRAILDGKQASSANNFGTASDRASLGSLWDETALHQALTDNGVQFTKATPERRERLAEYVVSDSEDLASAVLSRPDVQHIRVGCPLLRLPSRMTAKHARLFFDLAGVPPNKRLLSILRKELERIPNSGKGYNVLHARIEEDWMRHCKEWVGQDCLGDYKSLGVYLRDFHRIDTSKPLFVLTDVNSVNPRVFTAVQLNLRKAGYNLTLPGPATARLPREVRAILYYYLSLGSDIFIGNAVSTFAAALIMQRRQLGRPAIQYNEGIIPLTAFLPFVTMPWVFTVNGYSGGSYIDMVKRSVNSLANAASTLVPYALYHGPTDAPIYTWLLEKGVQVTLHDPTWIDQLWADAEKRKESNNKHSHLYDNKVSLLSTFARIDIPLMDSLKEFTYVLYTDNDVYFRGPVLLEEFGTLPTSVSMAVEMADMFPFNAGVMLMNLPYLRATYFEFIGMILDTEGDMDFVGYGPGDQGAYNFFYEKTLIKMQEKFNAKTYKSYNKGARIVHFHGPKPNHYLEQATTGSCNFTTMPSLCETGLPGFCMYAVEDDYFADDPTVQASAVSVCNSLVQRQ